MPLLKLKRIPFEMLNVNMVLGHDVVNSNGLILIPKGTVILEKHIFRLKLYQILSVVIVADEAANTLEMKKVEPEVFETDRSEHQFFNQFSNLYHQKETQIKTHLLNISNGEAIHLDDLLNISTTLLTSLRKKSDLFNYLHQLKTGDNYTYTHSLNVSLLCTIFGCWLNWNQTQIDNLTVAGLLHDIGKIQIGDTLLNKPGKLTEEEFNVIKNHSQYGFDLLKHQTVSEEIKLGILMHHEKMDGLGYPQGLKEDEIHDFAKIISICDIYDAMTSKRSYHDKYSPFKVIHIFEQESFGVLDTTFLFVFLENIAHYYLGKTVRLSTGDQAKIIFIHNTSPSRPIVQIEDRMVDLLVERSIFINEILF